jgi:outer membrane protein
MKKLILIFFLVFATQVQSNLFAQSKTAHVNTKILMDTLPSRKKALAEITEVTKRSEKELVDLDQQLKEAYEKYMSVKKDQSEQLNQYEESRLQKLQQDLQKRDQELTTLIQNMTITMNDNTYKIIQEAVKTIANKKGFQYVIEEATAVYAGGTSITNDVITELMRLDALTTN